MDLDILFQMSFVQVVLLFNVKDTMLTMQYLNQKLIILRE